LNYYNAEFKQLIIKKMRELKGNIELDTDKLPATIEKY